MGFLALGAVALAVATAGGPAVASPAASASASPTASASSTGPPAPAGVTASPALTQVSSQVWQTVIYVNAAALCPAPTFHLVTADPDYDVTAQPPNGLPSCNGSPPAGLTRVALTFGPDDRLRTPPVTAAVVIVPADATSAPVPIVVAVHRRVTWYQYAWIPLWCGAGLAIALIAATLVVGLPDPDKTGVTLRGMKVWVKPVYAPSAWSFTGSWATNITTAGGVVATLLAATGSLGEILPGVELGRFNLLVALAAGITLAAPLLLGALNYRFARIDPSTAGVSVLSLPTGPVAVLSGWLQNTLRLRWPKRRYGGAVVTLAGPPPEATAERFRAGKWVRLPTGARARPAGSRQYVPLGGGFRAMQPDKGVWPAAATIAVPAGATVAVSGATVDPPGAGGRALAGTTITIPPGAAITVAAADAAVGKPVLALPGGNDIVVYAGQQLSISQPATMPAGKAGAGSCLLANDPVSLAGSAKISFTGRAVLKLPAGTIVAAPGMESGLPPRNSALKQTMVFRLPHTGEVVMAWMWALLLASGVTLLGTGAELGILGVLAFSLAQASLLIRSVCLAGAAVLGAVVLVYSVVSIRALADPAPGDALNGSGGASFLP